MTTTILLCDDDDDYDDDGNVMLFIIAPPFPCAHCVEERRDLAAPRPGGRGTAVGSQKGAATGGGDG